jgi:predicted peroxiredoxin
MANGQQSNQHLIVLTHGQEDGGGRATLAFALAVSLQAMGGDVAVYLNAQAAIWAYDWVIKRANIPGFDRLETYVNLYRESGGQIYVCASCVEQITAHLSKQEADDLSAGVMPAGITTLASLMLDRNTISF